MESILPQQRLREKADLLGILTPFTPSSHNVLHHHWFYMQVGTHSPNFHGSKIGEISCKGDHFPEIDSHPDGTRAWCKVFAFRLHGDQ